MKFYLLLLAAAVFVGAEERRRYDGYKVLDLRPANDAHLAALQSLATAHPGHYDATFWKRPSTVGRSAHLMVAPGSVETVAIFLAANGIESKVIVDNVQASIDREAAEMAKQPAFTPSTPLREFAFDMYHTFDDIAAYLTQVSKTYSNMTSLTSIGKSTEGRDLWLLKIGKPSSQPKPGFWIDAGIHAREWIAPATALYIINDLLTNSSNAQLLDAVDFYILPSFNPDGYEYSRKTDRLWRKTRSGPYHHFFRSCYGVDPNRNWDFKWGLSGTTTNPCDETYEGPKAFSEPECANGAAKLTALKDVLKAMITLHSYSEDILYPYGYATHAYPPDVKELKELGDKANKAIEAVHGTRYSVVNSGDGLYPASGASDDWSKHLGIKWVYTIELRPGDGDHDNDSHYGFMLPASYILRTADEAWAGMKVMAERVRTGPN